MVLMLFFVIGSKLKERKLPYSTPLPSLMDLGKLI
jgi:hypothetical protein